MESNIVQLARFNTTNFASNTEWTTTLKQPVVLSEGDTAVVSKAYLDTRLNIGGNIIITEDTQLSLTYYFYMMFPPDGTSLETADGTPPITTPFVEPIPKNTNGPLTSGATINPQDLTLWACPFSQGPRLDQQTKELIAGDWNPYQLGLGSNNDPNPNNAQYINDGIPVPPWASYNTPPIPPYKQDEVNIPFNNINQCYAKEIPLLLTSTGVSDPPVIDESVPYTKVWTYTLKAGSYSPDQLAEVLTRAMSQIQPLGNEVAGYTAYDQYGTSNNPPKLNAFLAKGQAIALTGEAAVAGRIVEPLNPYPPYLDPLIWGNGMTYATNDVTNPLYPQANYILSTFLEDGFIPPAFLDSLNGISTYSDPLTFQQTKMTSAYSSTLGGVGDNVYTIASYASPVIGCSQPEIVFNDQAGVFQFAYTHTPLLELPTGGGVPGQNAGTDPIEVVKIIKTNNVDFASAGSPTNKFFVTGQTNITEHTKHSGIIFKDMLPKSFWQTIMGFDVDNLCVKQSEIWGSQRTMTFERFKEVTTSGFVGISNNFNFTNSNGTGLDPTINNMNQPPFLGPVPLYTAPAGNVSRLGELTYTNLLNSARWFAEHYILQNNQYFNGYGGATNNNPSVFSFPYATFFPFFYEEYASALTATNPITAISPPLSNVENVGHYLIEIIAYGGDKEFINTNTVYQIKNIVSSYYNSSGSFQSSPFPDAYVYNHTGETQIIHSFKVRIIDPYTMDTATNIGPSSSVYVQFNKPLTQTLTEQVS